jgi:fructokinase
LILVIGEILFDVFPEEKRLGGAPFNFAYHLQNLGLPVRLITRVGNDPDGREIMNLLRRFNFSLDTVQIDDAHPTGRVEVQLDKEGVPTFRIVPDAAYDYIEFLPEDHLPLLDKCNLIYFGTLAQRSDYGFKSIQKLLGRRPPLTRCLYDINLRPDCFTEKAIIHSLAQSDLLKLSADELETLRRILRFNGQDTALMAYLRKTFEIDLVALTRGSSGSELLDGQQHVKAPGAETQQVVDTVGAGDAFAAILAVAYLQGWSFDHTLKLAAEFAARVCEIPGAIPTHHSFYQAFKNNIAEKEYNAR